MQAQEGTLAKRDFSDETGTCHKISDMLSRIGDKWTVLIVSYLGERQMRFSELQSTIGNISQKMLTSTLRKLERDGFVTRTVTPSRPPRVDYALTELGRDLLVPVQALADWSVKNADRIEQARARFEQDRAG